MRAVFLTWVNVGTLWVFLLLKWFVSRRFIIIKGGINNNWLDSEIKNNTWAFCVYNYIAENVKPFENRSAILFDILFRDFHVQYKIPTP